MMLFHHPSLIKVKVQLPLKHLKHHPENLLRHLLSHLSLHHHHRLLLKREFAEVITEVEVVFEEHHIFVEVIKGEEGVHQFIEEAFGEVIEAFHRNFTSHSLLEVPLKIFKQEEWVVEEEGGGGEVDSTTPHQFLPPHQSLEEPLRVSSIEAVLDMVLLLSEFHSQEEAEENFEEEEVGFEEVILMEMVGEEEELFGEAEGEETLDSTTRLLHRTPPNNLHPIQPLEARFEISRIK